MDILIPTSSNALDIYVKEVKHFFMTDSEGHAIKSRSWFERLSTLLIREPQNREQLMDVLRHSEENGLLSAEMLGMIESILQVSEMQVREVMVPKSQMVVIDKDSQLADILPLVIESGHSRFPVIDRITDDVAGILLAKDLLQYYYHAKQQQFKVIDILRPTVFVPQSKRLNILLREFRGAHNHMAMVIDEYGHVAGLVTIEDVLEQIVGDIEDEYDIEDNDYIKEHADGSFTVKASTPIQEFNETFSKEFSDAEFNTIGGIILQGFGHLPRRGEVLKLDNLQFNVLHSDSRRLHLLEVRRISR